MKTFTPTGAARFRPSTRRSLLRGVLPPTRADASLPANPFRSSAPGGKEFFGPLCITNIRTFVNPDDPKKVPVLMDVPDMDTVKAAMESPVAADAMAYDTVVPETLVILVER